ncbi:unnamed protein product [Allacma fusca]|uniref:Alpha-1,3-mannosyl-glycoprotein 4-beta-N-acetylglucosaminyltransferase C n=1 Tax=Allacma fusca TaxID=39272 RepID=A0A8J2P4B6_9HEXA|nr:unnamed protein product [Allacma fusca]
MKHYLGNCRRYALLLVLSILATMALFTTNIFSTNLSLNRLPEGRFQEIESNISKCQNPGGWQEGLVHRARHALVAGNKPNNNISNHLILGISSVYRKENYLQKTLSSLIQESNEEERRTVTIVVYLADSLPKNNLRQLELIKESFQSHLDSGFLQVVMSTADIYPPMGFALTKRTFNDSMQRVLWRAKQVIDFSFLFSYAQPLGDYYLVVEDDVVASEQYITAIREFIASRREKRWIALQFTGFLGIGLLFRTKDLPKLNQLLWMFYQEQPVDMLMREFISIQIPETNVIVRRIPSLFQHIGVRSTLPNKVQRLTDNTFNMANRKFKHRVNPPADLVTSMKVYSDFFPEYAYRSTPGFFWGIAKPNDTLDIVFPSPVNITRIVIISGIIEPKQKVKDPIKDGVVEVGSKFNKVSSNNVVYCDNFITLGKFKDGSVDYNKNIANVQCIRVRVGSAQKSWVIIREIQVFL